MPNTHSTLTALFSDIADSIRGKTGQSGTIVADNFPTAIGGITTPVLQSKSATPSLSTQTITPDSPNNGLSSVSVSAVTKELLATLDPDFVAENIKKDVDLFGLVGTLEGGGGGIVAGTLTPASDITSAYTLTHNLGKIPQFFCIFLSGSSSGVLNAFIYAIHKDGDKAVYGVSNNDSTGYTIYQYQGANSNITDSNYASYRISPFTGATSSTITIHPEAKSTSIKSGKKYIWVAA